MKTLFALAFLLCISIAFGIKCNVCTSTKSMSDCNDQMKEQDCPANFDRCAKMSLNFDVGGLKTESYAKSCYTKSGCESGNAVFQQCKKIDGATCELDCCDKDGCNAGTVTAVSVILVVACTLMALFR